MKKETHDFGSLFYDNPLSSWIYDLNTFQILGVNKAAIKQIGYTQEMLLSINIFDLITKDQKDDFIDIHSAIQNVSGSFALGNFTFLTYGGEFLFKDVTGYKISFQERDCFVAIGQDYFKGVGRQTDSQQMMDVSLDVFCTIDEMGKFVYVSAAAKKHWGYFPSELEGTPFIDLVFEDDINITKTTAEAILSGKEIKIFTNRYIKKNGEIAYNSWSAIWDQSAKLMYCVARDGKENIEQVELLNQSELRFKALVQEGSDVISIVNREGMYTYISPTCTTILGMDPEEIVGRYTFEFIHPDDLEENSSTLEKIYTEKKIIVKPFRFLDSKKEWRWFETVLTNMLDNPAVNGIVANSRDVTDRVKEQQNLKLFESIITNTKEAVLITEAEPFDETGPKILFINQAFTDMTGYSPGDIVGKTPRILQGPNTDKKELARLSYAIKNYQSCEITTINYNKSGEEFWVNFQISPVFNSNNSVTHWVSIQRDVTEQKIQLLEKELLARISHNFSSHNNLQSAVKGLCKSVSKFGNFDLVEVWSANLEKSEMRILTNFTAKIEDQIFYNQTPTTLKVSYNEGLCGKVWANATQILWDDIGNQIEFERREAAKSIGLKAVLGIPLSCNGEVIGVMILGIKNRASYLKNYVRIFKKLEDFVGSELNRKKLESDLSYLFNAIPDILCITDFKRRFLKINKAGCELLGYTEEEILYHRIDDFVHPEDFDDAVQEIGRLENGEAVFEFENRYLTKDGEIVWLSWTSNSSIEEGVIYSVAKNITSEKKLRNLVQQSNKLAKIGSWEIDLVKNEVFWSKEVHQLHETDYKTFKPSLSTAMRYYRGDFQKSVKKQIKKCIKTGNSFDFEAVLVTANKKEKWIRAIGKAELINGKCERIYGSFQDIDERKSAEVRLQLLSDNIPGVVYQYCTYPDGTDSLKYVTKGALEIWGFSAEAVAQNNNLVWDQIIAGGDFEKVNASIKQAINRKSKWTARWKYMMPNGEMRTHLGYGSPSYHADGSIIFNSVILDVTIEVKNENLLQQVVQQAKIGSWEYDLGSDKLYWSNMVHQILETNPVNYVPQVEKTINFCRKDFSENAQNKFNECIQKGISFDLEIVIITANKKEKWVRLIGNIEKIEGSYKRIYGSIQDINSTKETENRLLSISQNLPGVVYQYVLNADGTDCVQYVTGEVEELWGYNAKAVSQNINLVWNQIKEGGDYDAVKESIIKSIKTKTNWTSRFRYIKPNGELKIHLGHGTPSFMTDGTILYNSIILDVTQEANNEQLLEQTSELARVGSWELDLSNQKGDAMYWSPMVRKILEVDSNYTPTLKDGLEFYIGENKEKVMAAISNLISTGLAFDEEILIRTYKGNIRWIRVIGNSETVNGKRIKVFGSLQDINDKKIVADQLQKSFEEKNEILESIGDAFCSFDKNWIVTYWNKEAEVVLGRKRNEIVGKQLWEEYPDVVGTEFYNQYQNAVLSKKVTSFEAYYETVNKWMEVSAYPSEEGLSVYFKDITLRKEADIRLLEANERFEKVTEATKDAIWDWDIVNNTYYRSKAIENFFGIGTLKMMSEGDFWQDRFHADDVSIIKNSIQEAVNNVVADRWELEYRVYNDQGEIVYVADQGIIIRNKKGKAVRMVGAMTDISEEKKMSIQLNELNQSLQLQSTELKRSNEELEQFAFVASHDLQEPLRMITSFMELLQKKYSNQLDEKGHQYIYYATDGAKRMRQIILDLLDYSRALKSSEGKQIVDLNEVISEFKKLRRIIISEKEVVILSYSLPIIPTYKAAVIQVFNCILDNAIKYSKKDKQPQIVITAHEEENQWLFSITDNGIGIKPEFHKKIFVIFQRLHNADKYAGTGIGLSIAKRHVEYLGGQIWLESTPGIGTTFHFTLSKNM